ncbi:ABC transporter permease [Gracilimonas amylolytica]|uniref:ABC transporter permease n=1 Tax=Gracilimonas amylolytica TaxID=1749045 RepID=UPI000CD9698B|nr:ABC transporter permease [Gracilimonas amylolytica]
MLQKILYNFDIALEAIQRNKLRAFLTSLGIIFGVSSVIAMLAIGNGAQQEVLTQMQLLGTNNVIVQPVVEQRQGSVNEGEEQQQSTKFSPGLTMEDLNTIRELVPEVEKLSPEIVYETNFIREARMRTGKLVGVNTDYFDISNFEVIEGSNFSEVQINEADPVCVIGYDVKTRFFAGEDPIGKKIKVGHLWLTVVGVLEKKEVSTENIENLGIRNFNLDIYAPVSTVLLRFKNRAVVTSNDLQQGGGSTVVMGGGMMIFSSGGSSSGDAGDGNYNQLDRLIVKVTDTKYSGTIAEILSRMLKRRHNNVVDFEIIVPEQLLQQEQQTKRIFNIVLSTIASISLIVGGIGIMNIMLASVVERFREIGVRMAVGAQKKDIELQFLTEALTISITGGFLGIVLGLAFSYVIEVTADIATIVTPISIFISFGVAVLIGVVFGYYPAKRAAKHDPVHALRHE